MANKTQNTSGIDIASNNGAVTYTDGQLEKEDEKLTAYTDNATSIKSSMAQAGEVIRAVNKKFSNNPTYTTYVEFYINGLHLSTVSQNKNQNIVMSLLNEKNGSGEANKFTIQIAYSPLSNNAFDINKIDNAILAVSYQDKITKNAVTGSTRYCALRYGYGDENDDIFRTPWYFGMVLDYSCEFQDGMLIYTITGFSGLSVLKESKEPLVLNIPKYAQYSEESENPTPTEQSPTPEPSTSDTYAVLKPTEAVELLVRTYLQGGLDSNENSRKGVEVNGKVVKITPKPLSKDVCYDIKFAEGVRGSDQPVYIETQLDKNPAQAITDILNKAIAEEDYKKITEKEVDSNSKNTATSEGTGSPEWSAENTDNMDAEVLTELNALDKTSYSWYVADSNTENPKYPSGTIYVYKNNPKESNEADVDIVFNWMSPGKAGELDHMVLSFKPEYKGSVALAVMNQLILDTKTEKEKEEMKEKDEGEVVTEAFQGAFYVDDMGRLRKTENSISPPVGGNVENVLSSIEQEKSSWAKRVQYPYKATLVTLGIPAEIPITGRIRLVPMIYGSEHVSAGVYMVTRIRDTITTAGFQTEWELMKMEIPARTAKDKTINSAEHEPEPVRTPPDWTNPWTSEDLANVAENAGNHGLAESIRSESAQNEVGPYVK